MDKMYYYRSGNTQIGPVSIEQMQGVITPDTYVWTTGMSYWKTASEVPELKPFLGLVENRQSNIVPPPKPNNYLVLSIISVLFCLPFGVVAIIMSVMSDSSYNRGDYADAVNKAKLAKIFSLIGIIFIVAYIVFNIIVPLLVGAVAALLSAA